MLCKRCMTSTFICTYPIKYCSRCGNMFNISYIKIWRGIYWVIRGGKMDINGRSFKKFLDSKGANNSSARR